MLLVGSTVHVEFSNLVRVLARSWNLDGTCPVEVEVTQCESQVLNVQLFQTRIVLGHVEVGWENTSLSGVGWCQVKVKLGLVTFSSVLDETFVDNAA